VPRGPQRTGQESHRVDLRSRIPNDLATTGRDGDSPRGGHGVSDTSHVAPRGPSGKGPAALSPPDAFQDAPVCQLATSLHFYAVRVSFTSATRPPGLEVSVDVRIGPMRDHTHEGIHPHDASTQSR